MKKLKRLAPAAILISLLWIAVEGAQPLAAQDDSAGKTHRSRFSLKLTGGLSFPDTGDINGMIRSYEDATAQIIADGQSAVLDWKRIKSVCEGTVELQFALTDRVSLGLETGFMRKRFPGTWSIDASYPGETGGNYVDSYTYSIDHQFNNSFNIIPVVLNGYYFFHRGKFDFYIKGGIGCYFGRYELNGTSSAEAVHTSEYYEYDIYVDTYVADEKTDVIGHGVAHRVAMGLHSGIGMEWKLSSRIALNFEGLFRAVDLKNWKGYMDNSVIYTDQSGYISEGLSTYGSTSKTIYDNSLRYNYQIQFVGGQYNYVPVKMVYFAFPPEGKRASLRLDGLSFRIGLKIGL